MMHENQVLLERTSAAFLRWVESGLAEPVCRSEHGDQTALVVDGVHLVSPLDAAGEARRLAEDGIPDGSAQAWVYGVCPALVAAALERAERVSVVGLSRRAASAHLQAASLPEGSTDRLRFFAPDECPTPRHPRVVASAELRIAEGSTIRDALVFELAEAAQANHQATINEGLTERGFANRRQHPQDDPVRALFSAGCTKAIVAGGGPGLAEGINALMPRRSEFTLIAVSTALVPLEKMGVVPDAVVLIDAAPEMSRHITELAHPERMSSIPLVYALGVDTRVPTLWPGPRYAALLTTPGYANLRDKLDLGTLYASGTVTHAAADLAVQMGARDVVFCGVDLAYPGGTSHAQGAVANEIRAIKSLTVESVTGAPVPTGINLLGYLRDLEHYISAQSHVRFWNTSPAGAKIAGAPRYEP
ncbi:MAG: 6-hydroxymethylpterin diphosphokinase MptE-like protein [Myxococcota bacterium]|nr:6-hydroxymethylpterin diphosphokinase MptE-like protein [Myxococcota bacterium]